MFSEITRERFRNFKRIRRAYWSLIILTTAFVLSLFSEFIAGDKPLLLRYKGGTYIPVVRFYPSTEFGGQYKTEADYHKLTESEAFKNAGGWAIFPIISHGPFRHDIQLEGSPPHPPSWRHWLGTDSGARDVLSRVIHGFRISMLFALILMIIAAFYGIVIGGLQGYLGGKTDMTVQRIIEVWSALPFLYVVMLIGSIYGRTFTILVVVMSLFSWIGLSYYMRGEFLKIKNMNYVRAARALGIGPLRIFFRHILPNSLTPVITILPFTLISGIGSLTALDFLGYGLPPPTPSWGELMKQGLDTIQFAPWLAISATSALFVTLLLATFIGEGVREAFDPRAEYRVE